MAEDDNQVNPDFVSGMKDHVKKEINPVDIMRQDIMKNDLRFSEIILGFANDSSSAELASIQEEIEEKVIEKVGPGLDLLIENLQNQLDDLEAFKEPYNTDVIKSELKKLYFVAYELSSSGKVSEHSAAATARILERLQQLNILVADFEDNYIGVLTVLHSTFRIGPKLHKPQVADKEEDTYMKERLEKNKEKHAKARSTEKPEKYKPYNEQAIAKSITGFLDNKDGELDKKLAEIADEAPTDDPDNMSPSIRTFVNDGEMDSLLNRLADESNDSK